MIVRLIAYVAGGLVVGGVLGYFGKCTTGACPLTATPLRGAMYGGVLGLVMSMVALGGGTSPAAGSDEQVRHLTTAEEFKAQVTEAQGLILVDFYADWCGPCKRLAPILSSLAESQRERVTVIKVNVDKASELAVAHGVNGIPDIRFFRDGVQLQQIVGLTSKEALFERIVALGYVDSVIKQDD